MFGSEAMTDLLAFLRSRISFEQAVQPDALADHLAPESSQNSMLVLLGRAVFVREQISDRADVSQLWKPHRFPTDESRASVGCYRVFLMP